MPNSFATPQWVHHAIFYQIFPDRFAQSKRVLKPTHLESWSSAPTPYGYKGGDLLGVAEHLDYLQDLGITALYLNPIFQSACNHRYHTYDYLRVDPMLGGDAAFRELLKAAHQRGIRVVLDGVFNHASRGFFQFNDILENGASSAYLDWFDVRDYPLNAYWGKPNYRCWVNLAALPEFNHQNPKVREYIFSVARYWLDQGMDGWRLDVPFCIDDDSFWQEFRQVVKQANPEAYITGEIPMNAARWLAGDQFDGVMNYMLTYAIWLYFGGRDADQAMFGHWLNHAPGMGILDAQQFAAHAQGLLSAYPLPAVLAQMNLLDSHDTARFLSIVRGRKDLLKLAVLFLMTYPGAPTIYYGDEIGLDGGNDPDCRKAFPWDSGQWDQELFDFYRNVINLRKSHPVLCNGAFQFLKAENDLLAFLRHDDQEEVLVLINRSERTVHVELPLPGFADGTVLKARLGMGEGLVRNGMLCRLVLAPLSGIVLS
ncbi:MAG: alpha-amylase [Chloroflexi bacterium HGW-Chloroflexi-10]|nr:MAG: alpha-amylase [Chloroflexi bacterium HGW-Chloroflexi-10]